MTRKINSEGLDNLKKWEGLRTAAYRDAAGVWTIGYGHTGAAGRPYPKEGMIITEKDAETILKEDIEQYEEAVSESVKVKLSDNQFAALVSFCYNIGVSAFKSSTLLKKLNKGDYDSVPYQLMRWTKSKGKTLRGLVNRRAAEVGLWSKGSYVSSGYEKPTKTKAYRNPAMLAPTGGVLAGLGTLATDNQPIQYALAAVIIFAAVAIIIYFYKKGMG